MSEDARQASLTDDWDPRRDDPTTDGVYDPAGELSELDAPTMFYVGTTLGRQEWLDDEHVLLSAGTAWRNPGGDGFTIAVPEDTKALMVDSGGFQATVHFDGERYPYTPADLHEWAESIGADYVCGMDWACEEAAVLADLYDDLTESDLSPVSERIERSVEKQIDQAAEHAAAGYDHTLVPVVQGLTVSDYRYAARRLRDEGLARRYMAIGSVCKRDSVDEIHEVLAACSDELPATRFHLFGATRLVWSDRRFWNREEFASGDTHAWAMKTPEGNWTSTIEDKRRAFESFRAAIESDVERIRAAEPLSSSRSSRNHMAELILRGAHVECVCGTEIPPYGTDYTPGCRHCERTLITRFDQDMNAVDMARTPSTRERQEEEREGEASTLGDF